MIENIRVRVREARREKLLADQVRRLKNSGVTVFSSNCVGAVACHDLGMRFNSATVNLFMKPADYLRFLGNIKGYLALEPRDAGINVGGGYPMGALGDLMLHFVHYDSFELARAKWTERTKRVDSDNCCVVMVDRDGCTEGQAVEFDALPYDQKVFLTYRDIDGCGCAFSRSEWEDKKSRQTVDLCAYVSPLSAQRKMDAFDWPDFYNAAGACHV